jgi:hypothetical protein
MEDGHDDDGGAAADDEPTRYIKSLQISDKVWSPKALECGTTTVLAPVMERQGRDRSPLGLLERVVELDKVGELGRE